MFQYCRSIGQIFWDEETFLTDYTFYFVVIKNIPAPTLKKDKPRINKDNPLLISKTISEITKSKSTLSQLPDKLIIFRYKNKFYFDQFFNQILNHFK